MLLKVRRQNLQGVCLKNWAFKKQLYTLLLTLLPIYFFRYDFHQEFNLVHNGITRLIKVLF